MNHSVMQLCTERSKCVCGMEKNLQEHLSLWYRVDQASGTHLSTAQHEASCSPSSYHSHISQHLPQGRRFVIPFSMASSPLLLLSSWNRTNSGPKGSCETSLDVRDSSIKDKSPKQISLRSLPSTKARVTTLKALWVTCAIRHHTEAFTWLHSQGHSTPPARSPSQDSSLCLFLY